VRQMYVFSSMFTPFSRAIKIALRTLRNISVKIRLQSILRYATEKKKKYLKMSISARCRRNRIVSASRNETSFGR